MKLKKLFLLILLPLIFLCTGCSKSEIDKVSKGLNEYTIDIVYNEDHTLDVSQKVSIKNNEEVNIDDIKMHLYPRSFRMGAKSSVISTLNKKKCYYNGDSFGDINIKELSVNGEGSDIVLGGNDEDILDITLTTPLVPNDCVTIDIKYSVTLPNINHRFGYGENTINISNFYPILCMRENGQYVIDSYHYNGDPFYSDIANYYISIEAPSKYMLASTGNIKDEKSTNNTKKYNIQGKAVRDFAFILSDKFSKVSAKIDNIDVNYYYYSNKYPNEALQASIDSISTFNRLFGKYPYSVINVCESNFVHGGMEYPNLVYISDAVDVQSDYINVIVHELAHQWWYGVVGNNEFKYGWLDEGLTEYSTILFYNENPQYNVNTKELIKNTTNSFATFVELYDRVFGSVDTTMNRNLNEYNNESEYVYIAYVKGMLLFDNIHELLGHEKFIKALQDYYKDMKFKISTPDALISSFERSTNRELKSIFNSWIDGKVKILAVK